MAKLLSPEALKKYQGACAEELSGSKYCIRVCMAGCKAYGAEEVKQALEKAIEARGLKKSVEVRETGCQGFCAKAPVVAIEPMGVQYQEVDP